MDIDRCYERSFRFLFSMRLSVIYKLYFFLFASNTVYTLVVRVNCRVVVIIASKGM